MSEDTFELEKQINDYKSWLNDDHLLISAEKARQRTKEALEKRKEEHLQRCLKDIDRFIKEAADDGLYSIEYQAPLYFEELRQRLIKLGYTAKLSQNSNKSYLNINWDGEVH